jgi:hypothetical protein
MLDGKRKEHIMRRMVIVGTIIFAVVLLCVIFFKRSRQHVAIDVADWAHDPFTQDGKLIKDIEDYAGDVEDGNPYKIKDEYLNETLIVLANKRFEILDDKRLKKYLPDVPDRLVGTIPVLTRCIVGGRGIQARLFGDIAWLTCMSWDENEMDSLVKRPVIIFMKQKPREIYVNIGLVK